MLMCPQLLECSNKKRVAVLSFPNNGTGATQDIYLTFIKNVYEYMSPGGYKITDQGAMYFVSFVPIVRDGMGRRIYEERIQRCSNRKFKILSGEKRSGALCLVYDEQPFAFNNFC